MSESFKVGSGTKIYEPVYIVKARHHIDIGENCRIGQFSFIAARRFVMMEGAEISPQVTIGGGGDVILGKYSTIDYGARLIPATFTTKGRYMNDVVSEKSDMIRGSVTLGEGAVVGANAVICVSEKCPHIRIDDFTVIGAGAYIDESVPSEMWVGPVVVYPKKDLVVKKREFDSAAPSRSPQG